MLQALVDGIVMGISQKIWKMWNYIIEMTTVTKY